MNHFPQAISMDRPPERYSDDYATAYRLRPPVPRQVRSSAGSLEALVTWNAPEDARGIAGFRIYKDTESNLLEEIRDPARRQAKVKLPANTKAMIYVSAFTTLNRESPKVAVLANSNTDKMVVTGTAGETSGSEGAQPPGWSEEPGGGDFGGQNEQFVYS